MAASSASPSTTLQLDQIQFAIGLSNPAGATSWYGRFRDGGGRAELDYSSRLSAGRPKTGRTSSSKVKPLHSANGEAQARRFSVLLDRFDAFEFGAHRGARQTLAFRAEARTLGTEGERSPAR